ncbi:MAG: hypothetical protein ABR555_10705 [Pyrinomonadaceae bacterium]
MNCHQFADVVGELARKQIMHAETRRDASAHVALCNDCRRRLENEQTISQALSCLAKEVAEMEAPAHVEERLRLALRARTATTTDARNWGRYGLAAAAMVLLLITGGKFALKYRHVNINHPNVAVATTPKQVRSSTAVDTWESGAREKHPLARAKQNRSRRFGSRQPKPPIQVVAQDLSQEVATDFIPLGSISAAGLQDGGQIVRVEMPRSFLTNFGLPMNMDRYDEKVKADVLLGIDGLAHAIRFVQ